jgi:hypothetical protein
MPKAVMLGSSAIKKPDMACGHKAVKFKCQPSDQKVIFFALSITSLLKRSEDLTLNSSLNMMSILSMRSVSMGLVTSANASREICLDVHADMCLNSVFRSKPQRRLFVALRAAVTEVRDEGGISSKMSRSSSWGISSRRAMEADEGLVSATCVLKDWKREC